MTASDQVPGEGAPRPGEPPAAHLNRTTPRRIMKSRTRTHALLVLPATAAVLTLLVGCSDDAAQTAQEVTTAEPSGDTQTQEMPEDNGVTGEIAAVSDLLMQVQDDDGQTAVAWDDSTTITQTVSGTLADVAAGVCVVAITASADDTSTAATSIAISTATDGECTTGFGGGTGGATGGSTADGTMPSGQPTGGTGEDAPSDMPTDMASGAPSGGTSDFGGMTSGLVTAVDASTITVETTDQDGTTSTSTVTVGDSTTYTTTVAADSSAITVGRCVTAQGEADDSGQVTATSLTLSDAGDEGCSTSAGGQSGFGGGQPGAEDSDD
ncbi:MAG TPA: hypothetical protein VGC67_14465 [Cellulomonas sp.]